MLPSTQGSFRLFSAFGISVFLHWSWFVIIFIMFNMARGGGQFQNDIWYAVMYVGLFAIVLLHEFGHSLACKSVGGRAERIVLWPLGGVAYVQPPQRPGAVLWSIVAGPLVNVVLTPILLGAAFLLEQQLGPDRQVDLQECVRMLAYINIALLIFNMLPIYPLDGGQTLQALLWFIIGRVKSLRITAIIGIITAAAAGGLAAYAGDVWFVVMAVFIGFRAIAGLKYARHLANIQEQGLSVDGDGF